MNQDFFVPLVREASNIRRHCLNELLQIQSSMSNVHSNAMDEYHFKSEQVIKAHQIFIAESRAEAAIEVIIASFEAVRCFKVLIPLIERIDRVQQVIDSSLDDLRALPGFGRVSQLINGLSAQLDDIYEKLPTETLINLCAAFPELLDNFNELLNLQSEEIQQWWTIWVSPEPCLDTAINSIVDAQPVMMFGLN